MTFICFILVLSNAVFSGEPCALLIKGRGKLANLVLVAIINTGNLPPIQGIEALTSKSLMTVDDRPRMKQVDKKKKIILFYTQPAFPKGNYNTIVDFIA